MSDVEKIYAYACRLGSGTPIQLRWEGAGDASHAASVLGALKFRKYPKSDTRIKYHATINIYESEDSTIYSSAEGQLQLIHWGATDDQTWELTGSVDVTRDQGTFSQNSAHVMFVRNIMPTNDSNESLTSNSETLLNIHKGALRGRSGSISKGGVLRLGASGAPSLFSTTRSKRNKMPVRKLFVNSPALVKTANTSGLKVWGKPTRRGDSDSEDSSVMKNNSNSLGVKRTYYLTFMK